MIDSWLNSPIWVVLPSFALLYVAVGSLLHWASFHGPTRRWIAEFRGVEGPVFAAAALLFAMLTGFVASDVWHRNAEAANLVTQEGEALATLQDLALAANVDSPDLRARIEDYARVVVTLEWPSMGEGRPSPAADRAMQALLHEVLDPRYAAAGPVQQAMLAQTLKVRTARGDRIIVSGERTDPWRWSAVIMLSVLAQIAIALTHLDKPLPQLAALAVFSISAFVGLGLVAVQENPFTYPLQVSPAPIEKVLQAVPGS